MTTRKPLLQYLRVQEVWERQMLGVLQSAASDIEQLLLEMPKGFDRDRLMETRRAINTRQSELWSQAGSSIQASQMAAAAQAAETGLEITKYLRGFPDMTPERMEMLRQSMRATAERGYVTAMQRVQGASYRPLAESVYRNEALTMRYIDRAIESGLVRGLSARDMANEVKRFIRPDVKGGVSYAAMRLGRTEINNAFQATQVRYAAESPWITGVQWNLSSSHPEEDECDVYAAHEPYAPEEVPARPHPQCFCFMTYEQLSFEEMQADPRSQQHIDQKMREAGYTEEQIAAGKVPTSQRSTLFDDLAGARGSLATDKMREVFEGQTFGDFETRVGSALTNRNGMSLSLDIMDGDKKVGSVGRRFERASDGSWTVHHDSMSIDKAYRGRGFSSSFSQFSENLYRENGVSQIKLYAAEPDGVRVWARAGYQWDTESPDYMDVRKQMTRALEDVTKTKGLSDDQRKALDRMTTAFDGDPAGWPQPFDVVSFDDTLGPQVMMKSGGWDGVKKL